MAYPDNPEFIDFVDERTEPAEVEEEEHSISTGHYTYSLGEVPDTEFSISCMGDVKGPYTVSFTNAAPGSGCVYVNPLNGNVLHCATDAPDDLKWSYWGRGTANNKFMLEQYREPLEAVHRVARQLWVSATSPASQGVSVAKGNAEVAGKLVEYNGGTWDFSSITFDNPGYCKAIRLALTSAGSVTYSEGSEASSRALCDDPPAIPESKTLAIIFLQDGASIADAGIVNTLIEVSYHSGDPDSGGSGDVAKYQYASGVVSGDAVCLTSPNTVSTADADDDDRVPSIGFVEEILDETYCTVRSSGVFDFSSKSTSYDSLTYGQQVYLSAAAGRIAQIRNQTPGEWDQPLGIALSASRIQISIGAATKNKQGGVDPDDPAPLPPEGAKFKRGAAVSERDFVYLDSDLETVKLANASADGTMPSIGIVDRDIDACWCIVKNNYTWVVADHGGLYPGGLTPGGAGDVWYISVSTAGQVDAVSSLSPDYWVQVAVRQIDAGGTKFLICCGTAVKPQPSTPDDGYDMDCAGVSAGHAVYVDSSGIARPSDVTDDAKVNAIGIAKTVNAGGTRCTVVRPPNVYNPSVAHPGGKYLLSNSAPGHWAIEGSFLLLPGQWKVQIGIGRGSAIKGLLVDIKNYGKFQDPGEDDGTDDNPTKSRWIGVFKALFPEPVGSWVQDNPTPGPGYVELCDYATSNQLRGVVLACVEDTGTGEYIISVLMRGLYNVGGPYSAGQLYFSDDGIGGIGPIISLGKYLKTAGLGTESGYLYVDPQPSRWVDGNSNITPITLLVPTAGFNPVPVQMHEKVFTDLSTSGSKMTVNYVGPEVPSDGRLVIASITGRLESSGSHATYYVTIDVKNHAGVSLLSQVGTIKANSNATGDTIPGSANLGSNQQCIVDPTLFPLAVGDAFRVYGTLAGIYSTYPYGLAITVKYYYVAG
ncbi:MAG: hypothetical protein JW759_08970 [Candidatus Coatesbacteria bacterium]|nr:hypothetical protein [Candidatus Coatesbacteria bacterium]